MDRKVLTIFLASPSDLAPERRALRDIVERLNRVVGRRINWHVELVGWEDTLPGYSRPQAIINKDVDACNLFIGMLWQTWGTPTGQHDSGFEEEFILALERRRKSESPEIWLYFKSVDDDRRKDPGPQLKKVLDFKNEQIMAKELLFREFGTPLQFADELYDNLVGYLQDLALADKARFTFREAEGKEISERVIDEGHGVSTDLKSYPKQLVDLFSRTTADLSAGHSNVDVWKSLRLLLISSTWFAEQHTTVLFGNHEINLVHRKRGEWELSESERWFLFRSMITDQHDHKPGWCWHQTDSDLEIEALLEVLAMEDPDASVRENSLRLLKKVGYNDEEVIITCLRDKEPKVIIELIDLLRNERDAKSLKILDDLVSNANSDIANAAKEVRIEILYKQSPERGLEELIDSGIKIPKYVHMDMLQSKPEIRLDILQRALTEAEPAVRLSVAELLQSTNRLSKEIAHKLQSDPDPQVRMIGTLALIDMGEEIDIEKIRKLFPVRTAAGSLRGLGLHLEPRVDESDLLSRVIRKWPLDKLQSQVSFFKSLSEEAYGVLASEHFNVFGSDVRSHLDDNFAGFIESSKKRMLAEFGDAGIKLAESWEPRTMEFAVSRYISTALYAIAKNGTPDDIRYARKYVGKTSHGMADGAALQVYAKFGNASDVEQLLQLSSDISYDNKELLVEVIIKLAVDIDSVIWPLINSNDKAIATYALKYLAQSDSLLCSDIGRHFLTSETDSLRVLGVALLVKNMSPDQLISVLNGYSEQESYFYNVVTWFDRVLYAPGYLGEKFKSHLLNKLSLRDPSVGQ